MWAPSLLSLLFSALTLVGLSHSSPVGDALKCLSVVRTKNDTRSAARCQSQIFPGTCEQPRCEYPSTASKPMSPKPLKDQSRVHALCIRGPTSTSLSTRVFPISNIAGQAIIWLHTQLTYPIQAAAADLSKIYAGNRTYIQSLGTRSPPRSSFALQLGFGLELAFKFRSPLNWDFVLRVLAKMQLFAEKGLTIYYRLLVPAIKVMVTFRLVQLPRHGDGIGVSLLP